MSVGNHVQSNFGHDGWDPPQDYSEFQGGGGGGDSGGASTGHGPYRFKLPVPEDNPIEKGKPARKRIMIIGAPFYLWEHSTYKYPNPPRGVFNAICLKQNRIADACPLCADKRWPSYGAYFTIIDLGFVKYTAGGVTLFPEPWTDKDGKRRESQFQRRLMVAKKGGKDKPGKMAFFEDQRNRRGDLTGCVFDTVRMGGKEPSIGETWEFVERVGSVVPATVEDMKRYLANLGATDEYLAKEWALQRYTIQDMEKGCLFPAEEMARWIGQAAPSSAQGNRAGGGTTTRGAGYDEGGQFRNDEDFRGGGEHPYGRKDW